MANVIDFEKVDDIALDLGAQLDFLARGRPEIG